MLLNEKRERERKEYGWAIANRQKKDGGKAEYFCTDTK